jgi:hypothetical protein
MPQFIKVQGRFMHLFLIILEFRFPVIPILAKLCSLVC